jgi:ketosteroid isomerase-like protein
VAESSSELARRVLNALGNGDVDGFVAMVHPEIEIRTARGVLRGREQVEEWAHKKYEHLERRFSIDELRENGDAVIALVRTQYVWRESGLVGDEEPLAIELAFKDGKLSRWVYREDLAGAKLGPPSADGA